MGKLLKSKELAVELNLSYSSIRNLLSHGMPHLRIGGKSFLRFDADAVRAWLEEKYKIGETDIFKGKKKKS